MVTPDPPGIRCLAVEELAGSLQALPEAEFTPDHVTQYLRGVRVRADSLEPYLRFDPQRYTRNLIYRSERFELLAICWEAGQRSAVHNHAGQQCWMVVPIGRLYNQNFRVVEQDERAQTCRLEPTTRTVIDDEHPLQVDPLEPVHQVINPAADGTRAVSLHIYSQPYNRCLVYSLENGRYGEIALNFTTEYGKSPEERA